MQMKEATEALCGWSTPNYASSGLQEMLQHAAHRNVIKNDAPCNIYLPGK